MNKQQFNELEVMEQLTYINNELSNGHSLRAISSKLGMSKSTIRDRFSKIGYLFNADTRQYCKDNDLVIPNCESITKPLLQSTKQENNPIIDSNILELQKYKDDLVVLVDLKNDIVEMLNDYKSNTKVIELSQLNINMLPEEMKSTIVNKSIKVYGDAYKSFDAVSSQYKGIKKQDLMSIALLEFCNKYNKNK